MLDYTRNQYVYSYPLSRCLIVFVPLFFSHTDTVSSPHSTFYVWTVAARNHHWLVSLGAILVLITFAFQPLAAALFNVQDVFWTNPRSTTNSLAAVGLNQDQNFQDLTCAYICVSTG